MNPLINCFILLGVTGVLLAGCRTSVPEKSPAKSGVTSSAILAPSDDMDPEDASPDTETSKGTPESLAHFAAGISYALRDKSDEAVNQFYEAAIADPRNEPLVLEVSRNLLAKKQVQKAIDLLLKSGKAPESSATVHSWLAQAYLQGGQTNQAIAASRLAVQKAPDSLEGYQILCVIYLRTAQFPEALKVLNRAEKKVKPSASNLIDLAELYAEYLNGRPGEQGTLKPRALKVLSRVDASNPEAEQLLLRLAEAYRSLDEPAKAAELYLKLLPRYPKPSAKLDALREKLANLYLMSGDKKRATEQLEAILHDSPARYPQVWYVLGTLACDAKQFTEAINKFEKALLLDPDMEQAYYQLALAQIDDGKTGDALRTLEKASTRFPNTFVGEFFTGVAYARLKSFGEAMKHFTSAEIIGRTTQPKRLSPQFYFQIGAAAERNHQFQAAVEYFQKSLELDPNFHEAMNYLGYMWAERGENLSKARELIEKALKAEPKNGAFLDSMGWVLFKENQPREALPWLLKAVENTEEPDATLFDHLGDVYQALGQTDKAKDAWKKSLAIEPKDDIKKKLDPLSGKP